MHASDISNPYRPLGVYMRWTQGILTETFAQVLLLYFEMLAHSFSEKISWLMVSIRFFVSHVDEAGFALLADLSLVLQAGLHI